MKPTDLELQLLIHFEDLKRRIDKQIHKIKDNCKEYGSFATENYICSVSEHERRGLAGIDQVAAVFGLETLRKHDLVKVTSYKTVEVTKLQK